MHIFKKNQREVAQSGKPNIRFYILHNILELFHCTAMDILYESWYKLTLTTRPTIQNGNHVYFADLQFHLHLLHQTEPTYLLNELQRYEITAQILHI
jgi:hypothetical protein